MLFTAAYVNCPESSWLASSVGGAGAAAGAQPWHVSRGGSRAAGAACPGAERAEEAVCPPLASFRASPQTCSGWMRDEPLGSPRLQFLGCAPALPCAQCSARLRCRWVPSLGVGAGAAHPAQGQHPPAGTGTAFRQLADSNWLVVALLRSLLKRWCKRSTKC